MLAKYIQEANTDYRRIRLGRSLFQSPAQAFIGMSHQQEATSRHRHIP